MKRASGGLVFRFLGAESGIAVIGVLFRVLFVSPLQLERRKRSLDTLVIQIKRIGGAQSAERESAIFRQE